MNTTTLELKPNRLLLDSNFDGYKLSLEEIQVSRKELETPVGVVHLNSSQYSFLHAKLFGLHNHIFVDRFDEFNSIYFVDQNRNIRKSYVDSFNNELVNPVTVYNIPKLRDQHAGDYNITLSFASDNHAVLSDGMGSIYILATRDKKDDDSFEALFSGKVLDNEEQGFVITDSLYQEEQQELHVLIVHIQEDPVDRFISVIHWLTFKKMNEENTWGQTALRRLKTKGEIQYLYLEENCKHIYVVSENEVHFVINSENPVQNKDVNTTEIVYKWSQNAEKITLKFPLSETAEKMFVRVLTESRKIDVHYQTEQLLSGELFGKIDSNLTAWTIEGNVLEIVLNKEESGFWSELVKGDNKGEYVLDSCSVNQVNEIMENFTSDREVIPKNGETFNSQQIEECDFEQDKSETFERISGSTNKNTHKAYLGSHQIIVRAYLGSGKSPSLGIRHDVDVCLWQPTFENEDFNIKHEGTLLAFGYVQASKQNRKFIICSPNLEYAVISESSGHIFIYHQNKPVMSTELRHRSSGRRVKNIAQQKVFNLPNQDILGLSANNTHLFVLGETFILSLNLGTSSQ